MFERNIGTAGRVARGAMAVILLAAGVFFLRENPLPGVLLLASGGFVLFEALRGWCALRACGVRAKL